MSGSSPPISRRVATIALLAIAVWATAPPSDSPAIVIDQLLAVVDGKTIALSDLVRYRILFAPDAPSDRLLQNMIDHLVVSAEAERFGIALPPPDQVAHAVERITQSYGSRAQWDAAMQRGHLTPATVDQLVAEQIRVETFLNERVDPFVFVAPADIDAAYRAAPERFKGQSLEEAEPMIEQALLKEKSAVKRLEYMARLRSRAVIRQIADAPVDSPARP